MERTSISGQIGYRVKRYGISGYRSYYEDLFNTLLNYEKTAGINIFSHLLRKY